MRWADSVTQLRSQLVFRCWLSLHLQIRKWKMLGRHHGDSSAKPKESESDVHLCGCQSWGLHPSPVPSSPVMMECSICSGPYIGYTLEDSWQPRQRTQAGSAFVHQIITSKKDPVKRNTIVGVNETLFSFNSYWRVRHMHEECKKPGCSIPVPGPEKPV